MKTLKHKNKKIPTYSRRSSAKIAGTKKTKKRKETKQNKTTKWRRSRITCRVSSIISRLSRRCLAVLLSCCLAVLLFLYFFIFNDLPSPKRLTSQTFPVSTKILDRSGKLLYEIYADQKRTPIKLEELPDHVKQATIAIEDKNFYDHHGFDVKGWLRASFNTVFKRKLQGGSTITQQLIKNTLLTPERTIRRKIREFTLALAVEVIYSKDEILEMYFNQTPYGSVAYGIETAAQTYFNKSARDLDLAQASLLAGLPAAPTRYSPFGAYPEQAKRRQSLVLQRMLEDGYIDESQQSKAKEQKLQYSQPKNNIKAPHFVMYVKDQLVEKYGQLMVEQGGLRVTTTLDLDLQEFAQETIATETAKLKNQKVSNGAAIITSPKTGEILAMVGSKDYFADDIDGNVNVTTALRQPGSAIKPLNYALALASEKITLATVINDIPTCFLVTGQKPYCPGNYDLAFHGPTQVRFALGSSYNIPAVKILALNGLENFIDMATDFGITTFKDPKNYGLSLTLGGGEVKMIDMATAFGVFANLGERVDLVSVLKVEDYLGNIPEEIKRPGLSLARPGLESPLNPRVIPMEIAYLISHALLDNNARTAAFGSSSYLMIKNHPEVSVKTGTTNDKRDNWTIGYNQDILTVVWVGNNDNTPMAAIASGTTGASLIWNKIITHALKDKPQTWPSQPENVVGASVCSVSGAVPSPENEPDCASRFEYFLKGTIPTNIVSSRGPILINKTTNQPIQPGEVNLIEGESLPEWIEQEDHQIITDPLGTITCFDCAPLPEGIKASSAQIKYPL